MPRRLVPRTCVEMKEIFSKKLSQASRQTTYYINANHRVYIRGMMKSPLSTYKIVTFLHSQ